MCGIAGGVGLKPPTRVILDNQLRALEHRGWFNQSEVKKILELHSRGTNLDSVIWPMLMLELWARNWLGQ